MTRRTVTTTVREYDAEGRLVKETVTETADDNWPQLDPYQWTYPNYGDYRRQYPTTTWCSTEAVPA